MRSLTVSSPAKLNLFLRITGKRPDGYHNLVTLFHRISLADEMRLTKAKTGITIHCSNRMLPTDESNLVTKSYRLLQKCFPKLGGVRVYLKKNIPIGAGLGGGSSNAASMLLAMKKLYNLPLSQRKLINMGKKLGADVPFFLHNVNQAVARGRGDKIQPKPTKTTWFFVLITSAKGLQTKDVYGHYRHAGPVSLTKINRAVTLLSDFFEEKKIDQIASNLRNDLEQSAFKLRPSLKKIIANLAKYGVIARMTGSGPTIFALCSHPDQANRLAQKLKHSERSQRIITCHSL